MTEDVKAPLDPNFIKLFDRDMDRQIDYLEKVIHRANEAYLLGDMRGCLALRQCAIKNASELNGLQAIIEILKGVKESDKQRLQTYDKR